MTDAPVQLSLSQAIDLIDVYYDKSNAQLLEALAFIDDYHKHLTNEQRQQVHDACCRMTWADRFLLETPHDQNNPGLVACELKARIWKPELSMVTYDLALNAYLKRHDIK